VERESKRAFQTVDYRNVVVLIAEIKYPAFSVNFTREKLNNANARNDKN
jgi:hypothetical protein